MTTLNFGKVSTQVRLLADDADTIIYHVDKTIKFFKMLSWLSIPIFIVGLLTLIIFVGLFLLPFGIGLFVYSRKQIKKLKTLKEQILSDPDFKNS